MHYRRAAAWQKAMAAVREVYRLAPLLPDEERYGMRSQITRAGVSIAANVAEGWARETPRDKAHFFTIAQGSVAETETLLTLCEEFEWFPREETVALRTYLDEVSRILTTLRRKRRAVRVQGAPLSRAAARRFPQAAKPPLSSGGR